jgi:molybdenum cofactor synthesis domain-containing protein
MTMRPFTSTIGLDEAKAIIDASIAPIARTERVSLLEARGRVVASTITAPVDVPPFDRASMDGYAVIAADTSGATRPAPRRLGLAGRIYTGDAPGGQVTPGTCMEIATGAPLPPGADAVVMVEETQIEHDSVVVFAGVSPRQNVGPRGADIACGQMVLTDGQVLNPSRIGALAALGHTEVEVWARPTVAILSTGNEIAGPGMPLAPGQIYDINSFTLSAVIADHGGIALPLSTARDTVDALDRALGEALSCDVVVFSGGSSVGERDLVLDVVRRRGEVRFHGIAVKPGKPTLFGLVEGRPVFGMPGYPTSCLSNAYILLVPALRRLSHLPLTAPRTLTLTLSARVNSVAGRHQFYSVRVEGGTAVPAFKASGDITSMSRADGYIEIPAGVTEVEAGSAVQVTLF